MPDTARPAPRAWNLLASTTVLGVITVFPLIWAGVARHPASMEGRGKALLWEDIALLLVDGAAAVLVWWQRSEGTRSAIGIGEIAGLLLGGVFVANHLIEWFVPVRGFSLVIAPVFLMFALPAAAGSAAWER